MRVHMRGLRLWGVLCGEILCPSRPLAPVAPVPPTPPVLAADASEADMLSCRVIPVLRSLLRSSTHRVQLFGVSLTLFALLSVVLVLVAGL
jgi:hypothetical protein